MIFLNFLKGSFCLFFGLFCPTVTPPVPPQQLLEFCGTLEETATYDAETCWKALNPCQNSDDACCLCSDGTVCLNGQCAGTTLESFPVLEGESERALLPNDFLDGSAEESFYISTSSVPFIFIVPTIAIIEFSVTAVTRLVDLSSRVVYELDNGRIASVSTSYVIPVQSNDLRRLVSKATCIEAAQRQAGCDSGVTKDTIKNGSFAKGELEIYKSTCVAATLTFGTALCEAAKKVLEAADLGAKAAALFLELVTCSEDRSDYRKDLLENDPCCTDPCCEVECIPDDPCSTSECDSTTGQCVTSPKFCEDNNPCTIDICEFSFGCSFLEKDCDDGDKCTIDSCDESSGACRNVPSKPGSFYCSHTDDCCDSGQDCTPCGCVSDKQICCKDDRSIFTLGTTALPCKTSEDCCLGTDLCCAGQCIDSQSEGTCCRGSELETPYEQNGKLQCCRNGQVISRVECCPEDVEGAMQCCNGVPIHEDECCELECPGENSKFCEDSCRCIPANVCCGCTEGQFCCDGSCSDNCCPNTECGKGPSATHSCCSEPGTSCNFDSKAEPFYPGGLGRSCCRDYSCGSSCFCLHG